MKKLGMAILLASFMATATAADKGTVIRTSPLTDNPSATARTIVVLQRDANIDIVERNGGWYRVKTASGQQGWLRMANVRLGEVAAAESSQGFWGSLFSFTGRRDSRTAVATTGIRGLSEEDIRNAVPDSAAVDQLDTWAGDTADAKAFANAAGLAPLQLDELKEVK